MRNKKKTLIVAGIAVVAVIAAVMIGIVAYNNSTPVKLSKQLELGQKYLSEQDYEQAIVAYQAAIEIDPMNVDAYLGLADAYIGSGDGVEAFEVLLQGYEQTKNENIESRVKEMVSNSRIINENGFYLPDAYLYSRGDYYHIKDQDMKMICNRLLPIIEKYVVFFSDDKWMLDSLASLHYILEDYEECADIMDKWYQWVLENSLNWTASEEGYIYCPMNDAAGWLRDEYGRDVSGYDSSSPYEVKYEYGENGKVSVSYELYYDDEGDIYYKVKTEFVYDEDGRVAKRISYRVSNFFAEEGIELTEVSLNEYLYNEDGYTQKCICRSAVGHFSAEEKEVVWSVMEDCVDYKTDEYGIIVECGERYNISNYETDYSTEGFANYLW